MSTSGSLGNKVTYYKQTLAGFQGWEKAKSSRKNIMLHIWRLSIHLINNRLLSNWTEKKRNPSLGHIQPVVSSWVFISGWQHHGYAIWLLNIIYMYRCKPNIFFFKIHFWMPPSICKESCHLDGHVSRLCMFSVYRRLHGKHYAVCSICVMSSFP